MIRHASARILPRLFCFLIFLNAGWCSAATFTWNGTVSTDWFNKTNWTPAGVPASTDTINFTSGSISLSNLVTISGTFNWSGGTLGGDPLAIAGGGLLNINGNVSLENVFSNAGTVTMAGPAYLSVFNNTNTLNGKIYNLAGALWDIQTNATISCEYCAGNEFFNNAGTFRRSQGSSTATISIAFTNAPGGTVTNLAGTLGFSQGGLLTGTYNTAAGATTDFASGNFSMVAPPVISGPGICEFNGTTLTLLQNVPTNVLLSGGSLILGPAFQGGGGITNLTLSGSTLGSSNMVTGTLTWNSGTIAGALTITNGGLLNINGNVSLDNVLTNGGTVTMTGAAYLSVFNNTNTFYGKIYNLTNGLWDIQTNATISCEYCAGNEFFNNAGTLRRSQGSSTATISIAFTNAPGGTVTNLAATLGFYQGGLLMGTYNTAAGATTDFASGNFVMGAPPVISGPGVCEFNGTTLTLLQNAPTNLLLSAGSLILGPAFQNVGGITNLTLSGSTLTSSNTVTGALTWNGGPIAGVLTVAGGGVLNINGNVSLENVLSNAGTVTMTGPAYLSVFNNTNTYYGKIYNLAGALWDIQTNATIACEYCVGNEFFNNAGTLRRSQGSSTAVISISFTNTPGGTVTNLAATLGFYQGGLLTGTYNTAAGATTDFASGNFVMGTPPVISGPGVCEFNGTTLTLLQNVPTNLVLSGGSLILGPAFQNAGGITNLTLNGSTLASTNKVTGTLIWNGGPITAPLTVAGGGLLNINGNVSLENVLTNGGTVTMTGPAYLSVFNNTNTYYGKIYNLAGALWDIQTNATIACEYCVGNEFFNNAGTLRRSQGSSTATISIAFTNTATVDAQVGTLSFGQNFVTTGGTLSFGVSSLASFGQINVTGNVALNGTVGAEWLNGFTPVVGDTFALLHYGSESGTFANISLPTGDVGEGIYGATVFSLMITSTNSQTAQPVFLAIKPANPGNVVVSWPSSATGYNLQVNTNLTASGSWNNILSGINTAGGNFVFTNPVTGRANFFRLQSP
jgi:DNA-directed RNA polymerase subunit RPC12/RpoP